MAAGHNNIQDDKLWCVVQVAHLLENISNEYEHRNNQFDQFFVKQISQIGYLFRNMVYELTDKIIKTELYTSRLTDCLNELFGEISPHLSPLERVGTTQHRIVEERARTAVSGALAMILAAIEKFFHKLEQVFMHPPAS